MKIIQKLKKALFITGLVLIIAVFLGAYDNAEADHPCKLQSAQWNTSHANVGEEVMLEAAADSSTDCANWTMMLVIVEEDPIFNDTIKTLIVKFGANGASDSTASARYTFTQQDYEVKGGNESGNEVMLFEAIIDDGDSAKGHKVLSNRLILQKSTRSGGSGGVPQTEGIDIKNPLESKGINNVIDFINLVATWVLNLAIPIAVVVFIYGGILFLTSAGNEKRIGDGKSAMKYATIGLAIVLIGKGFVTLIKSIIELSG